MKILNTSFFSKILFPDVKIQKICTIRFKQWVLSAPVPCVEALHSPRPSHKPLALWARLIDAGHRTRKVPTLAMFSSPAWARVPWGSLLLTPQGPLPPLLRLRLLPLPWGS